jgi:hypothetical protein
VTKPQTIKIAVRVIDTLCIGYSVRPRGDGVPPDFHTWWDDDNALRFDRIGEGWNFYAFQGNGRYLHLDMDQVVDRYGAEALAKALAMLARVQDRFRDAWDTIKTQV